MKYSPSGSSPIGDGTWRSGTVFLGAPREITYSRLRTFSERPRSDLSRSLWYFVASQSLTNWFGTPKYTMPSSKRTTCVSLNQVLKVALETESSISTRTFSQSCFVSSAEIMRKDVHQYKRFQHLRNLRESPTYVHKVCISCGDKYSAVLVVRDRSGALAQVLVSYHKDSSMAAGGGNFCCREQVPVVESLHVIHV